jgi:hypothetical protein
MSSSNCAWASLVVFVLEVVVVLVVSVVLVVLVVELLVVEVRVDEPVLVDVELVDTPVVPVVSLSPPQALSASAAPASSTSGARLCLGTVRGDGDIRGIIGGYGHGSDPVAERAPVASEPQSARSRGRYSPPHWAPALNAAFDTLSGRWPEAAAWMSASERLSWSLSITQSACDKVNPAWIRALRTLSSNVC